MSSSSPILVLDSGLGGLTVVRAIRAVLPLENLIYFGDTARLPYGSKSPATVTAFVRQIIEYLQPLQPKHVVIACNTASALALPAIRAMFPRLAISGVVEPGAKAAVIAAGAKRVPVIGVIATEATIRSHAYERAILRLRNHARLLLRPTPLLVPLIEEGRRDDDSVVRLALAQYLDAMMRIPMDVLVLGCTHYPILKKAIEMAVGPEVRVIDSAGQCADDVARRLRAANLLNTTGPIIGRSGIAPASARAARGLLRCFVTDDAARFGVMASRFLGAQVAPPTYVSPDELYGGPLSTTAESTAWRLPA